MQVYKVGGAVRDKLLGLAVKDTDWVVVASTVVDMVNNGFKPIGQAFPVFLHPDTKEEYALARTEKKISRGYLGFSFFAEPSVTLEEDLQRRDLTINALAEDAEGNIMDPWGGKRDLENKVLRHVSDAFLEDPVRILRTARFLARFHHLGFTLAPETRALMITMVENGEVQSLQGERIWQETLKALNEPDAHQYFRLLSQIRALPTVMPGLHSRIKWEDTEEFLSAPDLKVGTKWALLAHSAGLSIAQAGELNDQLRVPKAVSSQQVNLIKLAPKIQSAIHNEDVLLEMLETLDAFRRPERFHDFIECISVINPKVISILKLGFEAARKIEIAALLKQNPGEPPQILIRKARLNALKKCME